MIVAIDTMTLIWGVRKSGTKEQRDRARWLFQALGEEEAQVIVPAVSLSEYLTHVEPARRSAVVQHIADRFIVAPFDIPSSLLAADLFKEGKKMRKGERANARKILRADSLIIATAKTHGANIFYSGDKDCRAMANRIMTARDLPDQPGNLFDYDP